MLHLKSANLGVLYSAGRHEPLPAPIPALTGAWCENGGKRLSGR
jgi:hypothetical protein